MFLQTGPRFIGALFLVRNLILNELIMKTTYQFIIFIALLFTGCEKKVEFDLEESEQLTVVDASIEDGHTPVVILSKSFGYFSEITPELLLNSFVHDAEITISDGSRTEKLKEYSYPISANARVYYYTVDSTSGTSLFRGQLNKAYSLEIKSGGKVFTATTSIPALAKTIDSLWWKTPPFTKDTTKAILMARITDPPGLGNYMRYFTKRNNESFFPGITSAYDDQIIDGTTYEVEVEKGVDRNAVIDLEDYAFFRRGDTVSVKLANIDRATFDFWRTMEYSYSSIGNPFSSPTKVLGNVKGGALGYFGGYAVQYKSLIIPK
jgi:hypothetical protein